MLSLLIAEDEIIEQKALKLLIEKNFHDIQVVAIANNGIELLTKVQEYDPDIAIVDITMPGMIGLEAIELLRHRQAKARYIINTAYDEFEFAKKAIGLKVDDYIIKPQRQEQTIATIKKLCDAIYEEKASIENQRQIFEAVTRIIPVLENEIMFSIFLNEPAEDSFQRFCEMRALSFSNGTMVSMLSILDAELKFNQMDINHIRESLNRSLYGRCNYLSSINANNLCLFIFNDDGSFRNWKTWLTDLLTVAMENLHKDIGIVLKAGVGKVYHRFSDISAAYQESLTALKDGNQGNICFYHEESKRIYGQKREKEVDITVIESTTDNLYVTYAMKHIGIMFGEPLSLETVADKIGVSTYYLSRLFKQELGLTFIEYLTGVRMKSASILAKNTRMSVNEIAAKVGYNNTTYFARVFKKYSGKSLSEFRMDARKRL